MGEASEVTVVVAMSGGVDSSVTAALLANQGYRVIGMMMRLWNEPGSQEHNRCCTPDAMAQARRVAVQLNIPFYAIDAQQVFYDTVVNYFMDGYARSETPNPCLVCNRHIRWEFLLKHAQAAGAQFMATGHYARLQSDAQGRIQILRAVDEQKDQSYVLHVLTQQQLKHAMFPLGVYTKAQVRQMARKFGLAVAERADSQDLCFLGQGDYRAFLQRNAPHINQPGPILNRSGQLLGQHQGLAHYTIGQRKGLGISSSQPLYVLEKDSQSNTLVVGESGELGKTDCIAKNVNWISGEAPKNPFRALVKIRYKAFPAWANITPIDEQQALIVFDQAQRDITPGQAAVFYVDEVCLGGGIIGRKP
jgi:tRNA-specific 2-thiouridylase